MAAEEIASRRYWRRVRAAGLAALPLGQAARAALATRAVPVAGLAALLLLASTCGGGADPPPAPADEEAPAPDFVERVVEAVVEQSIGLADGDPRYLFGSIHGIALHEDGRLFVADGRSAEIRVYDETGRHLWQFGRRGDGPGDFWNPCCLAFDPLGRLWVWSDGDLHTQIRYDAFDIGGSRPQHRLRIQGQPIRQLSPARRVLFDSDGNLLHTTFSSDGSDGYRYYRVHLDTTGAELRRVELPYVSPDSLGRIRLVLDLSASLPSLPPGFVIQPRQLERTMYFAVPGSATQLFAHSPRGDFVEGLNTRYEVNWYASDGTLLWVLRRPLAGPPLDRTEQDAARQSLQRSREYAERYRARLPDVPIPERHPPLRWLFFDSEGRLWVQHRIAAADMAEVADVYLADGSYLHTVRWPQGVRLHHGAVRGDVVYGVSLDEYEIPRLVRLRVPAAAGG